MPAGGSSNHHAVAFCESSSTRTPVTLDSIRAGLTGRTAQEPARAVTVSNMTWTEAELPIEGDIDNLKLDRQRTLRLAVAGSLRPFPAQFKPELAHSNLSAPAAPGPGPVRA